MSVCETEEESKEEGRIGGCIESTSDKSTHTHAEAFNHCSTYVPYPYDIASKPWTDPCRQSNPAGSLRCILKIHAPPSDTI